MWKCSLTVVLGEDDDADVISEERTAADPLIGLDLLWIRVKEQVALRSGRLKTKEEGLQLLGWADPILEPYRSEAAVVQQRLMDRARRNDEEVRMASILAVEPAPLEMGQLPQSREKGGAPDAF